MDSFLNTVSGGTGFPVPSATVVGLVAGPWQSFRIDSLLGALTTVVGVVGAVLALLPAVVPPRTPKNESPAGAGGDKATGGRSRRREESAHPLSVVRKVAAGLGLLLIVGVAIVSVLQNRPTYGLSLVVESGEIVVASGERTRPTLVSHRFTSHIPETLVTDPNPNKGAEQWLGNWLASKYAPDRPPLPFTVAIPADLHTEAIAIDGLPRDSYQLSYEVNPPEKIRIEDIEDLRLSAPDTGFYLVVDRFGYDEEKIWVAEERGAAVVPRVLTPKHPGEVVIGVVEFVGDRYDLADAVRGFLASVDEHFTVLRKSGTAVATPATSSGNPILDLNVEEEGLGMDLLVSGTFSEH
jgi:hypothetical protein